MACLLSLQILITGCLLFWESGFVICIDPLYADDEYTHTAFIGCNLNEDGAGAQSLPSSILNDENYNNICAVSESDEFVYITSYIDSKPVADETPGEARRKRSPQLPRNDTDFRHLKRIRKNGHGAKIRQKKQAVFPPIEDVSGFEFTFLLETSRDTDNVDTSMDAKPGKDYEHVSLVYVDTYALGSQSFVDYTFRVPIIQDSVVEESELFQVNFLDLTNYFTGVRPPPMMIPVPGKRDTENQFPCVKILVVDDDVNFKLSSHVYVLDTTTNTVTVTVERKGKLADGQTLAIGTESIGTIVSSESDNTDSQMITFTDAVSTTIDKTIAIANGENSGSLKAVKIVILSPGEGTVVAPYEAVIICPSVQTPPLPFSLDMNNYIVNEGDSFEIEVCRLGDISQDSTIDLVANSFDAMEKDDFSPVRMEVSVSMDLDKSSPITITTMDDNQCEATETFELALVSGTDKINVATVYIIDNDAKYCFDSKTYIVGEDEESVSLTVLKKGNLQDTTAFIVQTSDDSASFPEDYSSISTGGSSLPSSTILPAGQNNLTIDIGIQDDRIPEPNEKFNVNIRVGDEVVFRAIVLINDDDVDCSPPCQNNGLCIQNLNQCSCPAGFVGTWCETQLQCSPPCQNDGLCNQVSNECWCRTGFTGSRCETSLQCSPVCQNNGYCNQFSNECWCRTGFTGSRCETSLCSSPCQNGGVCSPGGVCLCPSGFTGAQCQTVLEQSGNVIVGQITILVIDGSPAVFTPALNVEGSTEQQELVARILPLLQFALSSLKGEVVIRAVSAGSIVVEYTLILPPGSSYTANDVDNNIESIFIPSASSSGFGIELSRSRTFSRELCPSRYCANGGTCTADTVNMRSLCSCSSGYSGGQCETRDSDDLSPGGVAGVTIGGVFLIVFIILLALCCFCYVRRRKQNKLAAPVPRTTVPTIETLDLAPYPYTYPRLDVGQQYPHLY